MVVEDARYLQRSRDLRHLLNGEWIVHVLVALRTGPLHYHELFTAVQETDPFDPWTGAERKIQSRALGRTLQRMVTAGLVVRQEVRTFPRSVVYSLTPAATDLLAAAGPMIEWAERHRELIERLQQAHAVERPSSAQGGSADLE